MRGIGAGDAPHLMAEKRKWPADAVVPLLECVDVRKTSTMRKSGVLGSAKSGPRVVAVDAISLKIERGECLGLVGESGCGKTTLSKVLLRAVNPDSGSIVFNDHGRLIDVLSLEGEDLKKFRRQVQFVFQDPFAPLNPQMTVYH